RSVRATSVAVTCFLLSSRRRHTRCYRDWSSDVCSSDLFQVKVRDPGLGGAVRTSARTAPPRPGSRTLTWNVLLSRSAATRGVSEIGRAAWRAWGGVCGCGGAGWGRGEEPGRDERHDGVS